MDIFRIGGRSYNVSIIAVEENFTILYSESTGRTIADGAEMTLDAIGTFYGHKITVRRKSGYEREFDDLFDYVSRPRSVGFEVEIVHNQSTIKYDAYTSNGKRGLKRISPDGKKVFWDELTLNIIPMKAQETP